MSIVLRVSLIIGSLAFATFAIKKIRSSTIEIGDSLFWIAFSFFLLIISIFPQIVYFVTSLFGIQLPVNMVFLSVIALLAYKCFSLSIKVSTINMKLKTLTAMLGVQGAIQAESICPLDQKENV